MDQDRQIRFLIPPFFLYTSLLWWASIDPYLHCSLVALTGGGLKEVLPVIAVAGGLTIPVGYSIGTLAMFILTLIFRVRSGLTEQKQLYDAAVCDDCYNGVVLVTKAADRPFDRKVRPNLLYAVATFDHELLPGGTHKWVERRWNGFNVAFNSALAIAISFAVVFIRHLYVWPFNPYCGWTEKQWLDAATWGCRQWWWLGVNLGLLGLLLWAACKAWQETMRMIEFQSRRKNVHELTERKAKPQGTTTGQ